MISLDFLKQSGPIGALLGLAILAILGLYKDHKEKDKQIDSLEEKRVQEAQTEVQHVTLKLESLDNTMKALLIAIEKKN